MGCDIHGWIEVKLSNRGRFIGVVDCNWILHRNYNLFANLCGDEGRWFEDSDDIQPMTDVRGLPDGVSDEVCYNDYSGLGYSHKSWF